MYTNDTNHANNHRATIDTRRPFTTIIFLTDFPSSHFLTSGIAKAFVFRPSSPASVAILNEPRVLPLTWTTMVDSPSAASFVSNFGH